MGENVRATAVQLECVSEAEARAGGGSGYCSREDWMADADASTCMSPCCASGSAPGTPLVFTLIKRRHHCRRCGRIFCGACSSGRLVIVDSGSEKPHRVCAACVASLASIIVTRAPAEVLEACVERRQVAATENRHVVMEPGSAATAAAIAAAAAVAVSLKNATALQAFETSADNQMALEPEPTPQPSLQPDVCPALNLETLASTPAVKVVPAAEGAGADRAATRQALAETAPPPGGLNATSTTRSCALKESLALDRSEPAAAITTVVTFKCVRSAIVRTPGLTLAPTKLL